MISSMVYARAIAFVIFLFVSVMAKAQSPEKFEDDLYQDSGCEMTAKVVEDVFREALRERERVFIISRIGTSEKKTVGWQRLSLIENRLAMLSSKVLMIAA